MKSSRHIPPILLVAALLALVLSTGCAVTGQRPGSADTGQEMAAAPGTTAEASSEVGESQAEVPAPVQSQHPSNEQHHMHGTAWGWLGSAAMVGMMVLMIAL